MRAAGLLPAARIGVEWSPPRFDAVDPLKDATADLIAMRSGTLTLAQAIARQGYNPDAVLAEHAAMAKKLDASGLVFDSDPRRTAKSGIQQQQDAAADPETRAALRLIAS
jgi:capsid protein